LKESGYLQVAIAVGPVREAGGVPGFKDNMTSEKVDAEGVSNIVAAALKELPRAKLVQDPVMQSSDFKGWENKDDTVMGGKSSSIIEADKNKGVHGSFYSLGSLEWRRHDRWGRTSKK
jgi:hypothetical protein